jgi:Domain of unknown function (DUF4157)
MRRYCSPSLGRAARTASARPAPVRETQSIGNRASLGRLQTKLMVGMRTPERDVSGASASAMEGRPQERLAGSQAAVGEAPAAVHEVLRTPGQPLEPSARTYLEPLFNHSFGDVRIHADARAAESAKSINATAYTVGKEVVFDAGAHNPGAPEGRRLLAHELAHVVQQSRFSPVIQRKPTKDSAQPAQTFPQFQNARSGCRSDARPE